MTSTIQKIKVKNMVSPQSGRPVANQYIIDTGSHMYFQSYETIITKVFKIGDKRPNITLDKNSWNYSRTTIKYLIRFLGGSLNKQDILNRIDNGEYKLADLN